MTNALQIYDKFDTLQRTATVLYASGYFEKVNQAQAIVKVMAGAELGLPPFASMSGIHIVNGKPTLGSNLIATLVKNDPRYDYRVKVSNEKECILTWYEDGIEVGEAGFTMAEAINANITNKSTWKAYPSDMLFARAISRGARRFAPGIFGGAPVYTPDEMNVDTDEDGYVIEGEIVESEPVQVTAPEPARPTSNGGGYSKGARPLAPEALRDYLTNVSNSGVQEVVQKVGTIDDAQRTASALVKMVGEDNRHLLTEWLFGVVSTKDMTVGQHAAIKRWAGWHKDENDDWQLNADTVKEAAAALRQAQLDAGQGELFPNAAAEANAELFADGHA